MSQQQWDVEARALVLEGLVIPVSIGIHDFERNGAQRLSINVRVELDPDPLTKDEDIHSVVDYDYLRSGITALAESRHFELQETFCAEILDLCFSKSSVMKAHVKPAKLDVYPNCDAVGIEVDAVRRRGDAA